MTFTRAALIVTVAVALVGALAMVLVIVTERKIEAAVATGRSTSEITASLARRRLVLSDFIATGNERAERQLLLENGHTEALLARARVSRADERAVLDELRLQQAVFARVLDALLTNRVSGRRSSKEAVLAERAEGIYRDQLLVASQALADATRRLTDLSFAEIERAERSIRTLTLAVIPGLVVLVAIASAVLVTWFLRLLNALRAGVAVVAAGDLSYRHRPTGKDEISAVARAFDDMTAQLDASQAELNAANEELDSFAYSVSHDLRAPLRAMDGFARILVSEHSASLSDEAHAHLDRIVKATSNMRELIDGLLRLSRVTRGPLAREPVDTAGLTGEVVAELEGLEDGRSVELRVAELPPCVADRALLRQVFSNLLANAVKFTRARERPLIEVGCLEGAPPTFFVRDNGVGFDMEFAGKLFGAFERLHRAEDYEGVGIGLATVKRIVRRHGGEVWAQAQPDQGATFYFTLERSAA